MHQCRAKAEKRHAKRESETLEPKAARLTAEATRWIAIFTVVMAIVAGLTLWEIIEGGADTKALVEASKKQACAASKSAQAARDFADTAALINGGIGDAVKKLDTQARATQKSADTAREALTSVQRAFVVYIPEKVDIGMNKMFASVEGSWNNSGPTPAVTVWARSHFDETKDDSPNPNFPFQSEDKIKRFVLAERDKTSFYSPFLPKDKIPLVGSFGYFYGWAVYKDVFKDTPPHLTEFCTQAVILMEPSLTAPSTLSGRQASCSTHNCYDKECKDYKDRIAEATAN